MKKEKKSILKKFIDFIRDEFRRPNYDPHYEFYWYNTFIQYSLEREKTRLLIKLNDKNISSDEKKKIILKLKKVKKRLRYIIAVKKPPKR